MTYSITDTYKMKREILNFSTRLSFPDAKFTADTTYGILASKCLRTATAADYSALAVLLSWP